MGSRGELLGFVFGHGVTASTVPVTTGMRRRGMWAVMMASAEGCSDSFSKQCSRAISIAPASVSPSSMPHDPVILPQGLTHTAIRTSTESGGGEKDAVRSKVRLRPRGFVVDGARSYA